MKSACSITSFLILSLILGITNPLPLFAQSKEKKEHFQIDMQFGNRNIQRDSLPNGKDIDFMNYLYNDKEYSDYQFLHLGFTLVTSARWSFNAGMKMLSDLQPSHLSVTVRYTADSLNTIFSWGISSSLYAYPQYLEAFNRYHLLTDTGFTADLNPNFRQRTIYDLGLDIMPTLNFSHKRFHGFISTGIGIGSFLPFRELITQKKTSSNLRREIRYETQYSPALYSRSEIEAAFDLIKGRKRAFGIALKAEVLFSKRNIPYSRSILTWTETEVVSEMVKPGNQLYTKTDLSWGIYLRF